MTKRKIKKAVAAPGVIEDNGLLAFAEFVLLPAAALQGKREFVVPRERDGLPPLVYTDVESMQADYKGDVVSYPFLFLCLFLFLFLLFPFRVGGKET